MENVKTAVTVIILTKNEEKNIQACIKSASFAKEIVVVDSGSTDDTERLAVKAGARFVIHPMGGDGFAGQRNFALQEAREKWVFYLDADERITPQVAEGIKSAVEKNEQCYYDVKRINVLFGQRMRGGGFGPDYSQRLYPKTAIKWHGVVHEHADCSLPLAHLYGHLEHYPYQSWDKYFEKFNRYTTMMAEKMYKNGKRASFADMLLHPLGGFVRFYFFKQGFREGKLGFILAVNHYFYTMTKYVKLYYLDTKNES